MRLSRPVPYISAEVAQRCYQQVMENERFRDGLHQHLEDANPVLSAYLDYVVTQGASATAKASGLVVYHTIDHVIAVPAIEPTLLISVASVFDHTNGRYWVDLLRTIRLQNLHFAGVISKMIMHDLKGLDCFMPLVIYRFIEEQLRSSGPAMTRH